MKLSLVGKIRCSDRADKGVMMEGEMLTTILIAALAVSEALAFIPALASNSIFQLIVNVLTMLRGGDDK